MSVSDAAADAAADAVTVGGWIDTHCHLQLVDDPDADVDAAFRGGVDTIVCVGIDAATSADAVRWAGRDDRIFATVGLHPHEATALDDEWDRLAALAREPGVVAVGECGLDHYRDRSPHDAQETAFRRQIAFAKETGLALVIHTRDAWDDTLRILDDEGAPERTVFHCFSGGAVEARRCVDDHGAVLSIAGPVSYPRNEELRDAARAVGVEHLVVETDSPFLPPQGRRGTPNRPLHVAEVGAALAAALDADPAEVADVTSANARRLFGLSSGRSGPAS